MRSEEEKRLKNIEVRLESIAQDQGTLLKRMEVLIKDVKVAIRDQKPKSQQDEDDLGPAQRFHGRSK